MAQGKIIDARIGSAGQDISLAFLEAGDVRFGRLPYRGDLTDALSSAVISLVMIRGVGVEVAMSVPSFSPAYDRVHFEAVVSASESVVVTGEPDESLVAAHYFSELGGPWFIELDDLYEFPSAGADSTQTGKTVKLLAVNINLDPSQPAYVYWRPRRYKLDAFVSNGPWQAAKIRMFSSLPLNTGALTKSNEAILLQGGRVAWTGNAQFEVEVYTAGSPRKLVLSRDSTSNNSGFRYFDGYSFSTITSSGLSYSTYGAVDKFLVTNPLESDVPLVVRYRAKYGSSHSAWAASLFVPTDTFNESGHAFSPMVSFDVAANQYPDTYHVQVLLGTNPDLGAYFTAGDINLPMPDLSSPDLLEFADSYDPSYRGRFAVFDPTSNDFPVLSDAGINNALPAKISYFSTSSYMDHKKTYALWRVKYRPTWPPAPSPTMTPTQTLTPTSTVTPTVFVPVPFSPAVIYVSGDVHLYVNGPGQDPENASLNIDDNAGAEEIIFFTSYSASLSEEVVIKYSCGTSRLTRGGYYVTGVTVTDNTGTNTFTVSGEVPRRNGSPMFGPAYLSVGGGMFKMTVQPRLRVPYDECSNFYVLHFCYFDIALEPVTFGPYQVSEMGGAMFEVLSEVSSPRWNQSQVVNTVSGPFSDGIGYILNAKTGLHRSRRDFDSATHNPASLRRAVGTADIVAIADRFNWFSANNGSWDHTWDPGMKYKCRTFYPPTPTPTQTLTVTSTPTLTAQPTPTLTPSPTPSPTPTSTPTPSPAPQDCPSDCTGYPNYTAVVTGLGGGSPGAICSMLGMGCSNGNQSYTLTRTGGSVCGWGGSEPNGWFPSMGCVGQTWTLSIYCLGGELAATFTAPNTTGYPPSSGWTKTAGPCTGGAVSLS